MPMKYPDPMVSICCITFNQEKYLPKALEGFLIQEVSFPIQFIFHDDFSTDTTRQLLLEFKEKSNFPVTLLFPTENRFSKGERIFPKTIEEAKGKYIALCEGDDYWTDPLKLQKQVDFMEEHPNYGICYHNVHVLDMATGELKEDFISRKVAEEGDRNTLARGNFMHTPSVLLRNDFMFPDWFSKSPLGDWAMYMLALGDRRIKRLEEVMAVYRVHDASMWSKKSKTHRIELTLETYRLIRNNLVLPPGTTAILDNRIAYYLKTIASM